MSTSFIDINTQGFQELTNKLEKLPYDVMPKVVGSTLNDLSFDAKGFKGRTGTIEMATRKAATYDRANKGFYKKITSVDLADKKGSIKTQESEAGISRKAAGLNKTAEGLARFNFGGGKQQDFNPVDDNRAGKKRSKLMGGAKTKNRVGGRVAMKEVQGKKAGDFVKYKKGSKSKYVAAAKVAYDNNKFLLIESAPNRGLLVKVTFFNKESRNENPIINAVVYGYYHQGRVVRTGRMRFIESSANETMKKGKKFFEANAKFRMERAGWK